MHGEWNLPQLVIKYFSFITKKSWATGHWEFVHYGPFEFAHTGPAEADVTAAQLGLILLGFRPGKILLDKVDSMDWALGTDCSFGLFKNDK